MIEQAWQDNIIEDDERMINLLEETKRIAVLGIKTEKQSAQAAFYVPNYLKRIGLEVIPVPVYYPEVTTILDQPVYRRLQDIPPPPVDLVDVFRRAEDLAVHVEELLAVRPKVVWFQKGIRNDTVAEQLARSGIKVVQDRCLMIEYSRFKRFF